MKKLTLLSLTLLICCLALFVSCDQTNPPQGTEQLDPCASGHTNKEPVICKSKNENRGAACRSSVVSLPIPLPASGTDQRPVRGASQDRPMTIASPNSPGAFYQKGLTPPEKML